jgi:hypothetical protein
VHPLTKIIAPACVTFAVLVVPSCKQKVSQVECEKLVDRFATLVVQERIKDAPPEMIKQEQERERSEAKGDDNFKNCTSEVAPDEYRCAMATSTSNAFLKCLE